jgi:hypothetical protein
LAPSILGSIDERPKVFDAFGELDESQVGPGKRILAEACQRLQLLYLSKFSPPASKVCGFPFRPLTFNPKSMFLSMFLNDVLKVIHSIVPVLYARRYHCMPLAIGTMNLNLKQFAQSTEIDHCRVTGSRAALVAKSENQY